MSMSFEFKSVLFAEVVLVVVAFTVAIINSVVVAVADFVLVSGCILSLMDAVFIPCW